MVKTTIEIPDAIAERAKILAAERRTTLNDLIVQGLEKILCEKPIRTEDRAKKLFAAIDQLPEFSAGFRLDRSGANARSFVD